MTIGNAVTPTSTCAQARVMLYQPSQRPCLRSGDWTETSFGRCRIEGRLGQRHADVVESILYHAEKRRDISDGEIELLVDPARVRKTLSDDYYSHQRIWSLLKEVMSAVTEIETPKFKALGHLIGEVVESPKTRPDPLTGGKRKLWRVRLGKALVMLLEHDLSLYYDPAPIARLQHGISQAVARHILSHKTEPQGGWYLDTAITVVAGKVASKTMRNYRARLKEDAEKLEALGLILDGGRIGKKVLAMPKAPHSGPMVPHSGPMTPHSGPVRLTAARC